MTGLGRVLHFLRQDLLRDRLRVGLHWNVEVTGRIAPGLLVSQVFRSALPMAYTRIPSARWPQPFATLVLEAAYEATRWATVLNTHRTTSNVIYLTRVGGGAFGNETAWIAASFGARLSAYRLQRR